MARSKREVNTAGLAVGWISEFLATLVSEVKKLGGTGEDWRRLATPDGVDTVKAIAKAIVNPLPGRVLGEWVRSFHYGRTTAEIVEAGNYISVTERIGEFPIEGSGQVDFEVVLFEPDGDCITSAAIDQMAARGLFPAGAAEMLAFTEGIDDAFRKEFLGESYQIVALSAGIPGPVLSTEVLCVDGDIDEKHLYSTPDFPEVWPSYWFLAVRTHYEGDAVRKILATERGE